MNVENQISGQIGQNPVNQPVASPEKPKTKYFLIGGIVLACFVITGFAGYSFGKQTTNTQLTSNLNLQTPTPTEISTTSIPTTTNVPVMNKTTLVDVLTKSCVNNKIALDKLPFTISQNLMSIYKIQDTINCFAPEESYATISLVVNTPDFSGNERVIHFFHDNSKFFGMGDAFQSLSNYHQVTINGQNYWLRVEEPGPYGISTLGVSVGMMGEKKDPASGTIIRVIDNENLKSQDLLDLVKKYGAKQTNPNNPEYIITDPNKKTQFIQEVVSLAGQHAAFKKSAQDVTSDLNGISF